MYFPQKSGYIVVNKLPDGTVVFTPNQEVASAFLTARKMSGKVIYWVLSAILLVLLSGILILWGVRDGRLFSSWEMLVGFFWLVFFVVLGCGASVLMLHFRCRKLKKIYRNKVVLCRRQPAFDRIEYECL